MEDLSEKGIENEGRNEMGDGNGTGRGGELRRQSKPSKSETWKRIEKPPTETVNDADLSLKRNGNEIQKNKPRRAIHH